MITVVAMGHPDKEASLFRKEIERDKDQDNVDCNALFFEFFFQTWIGQKCWTSFWVLIMLLTTPLYQIVGRQKTDDVGIEQAKQKQQPDHTFIPSDTSPPA